MFSYLDLSEPLQTETQCTLIFGTEEPAGIKNVIQAKKKISSVLSLAANEKQHKQMSQNVEFLLL